MNEDQGVCTLVFFCVVRGRGWRLKCTYAVSQGSGARRTLVAQQYGSA